MAPILLTAEDLGTYLNRLQDQLQMVGTGSYSAVFKHPTDPDIVVKVSINDPVYMQFVSFCRRNKGNRWLPKILDVHDLELEDHRPVHAIFMPRLVPASDAAIRTTFKELAPWIDVNAFSDRKRLSFPQWRNVVGMTQDPETKTMATWMWRHFNRLDLLNQNFMRRGNQIVFNDPVASKE